jgi:hypothetical protein
MIGGGGGGGFGDSHGASSGGTGGNYIVNYPYSVTGGSGYTVTIGVLVVSEIPAVAEAVEAMIVIVQW